MNRKLVASKGYSIAVLHTHTDHTDGMVSPKALVEAAAQRGVRVLAITDHDTFSPIAETKAAGRKFGVEVITGQEIQTSLPRGLHIIGLFLKEAIPHSKPIEWTVKKIREQRGIAVIAHPFVRLLGVLSAPAGAFQMADLKKLVRSCGADAVELRHRFLSADDKAKLDDFYYNNQDSLGAILGASDSHFGEKDMFEWVTVFPGKSAKDLYTAIKDRTTKAESGPTTNLNTREVLTQMKKSIIDVGFNRYRKMIKRWAILNYESVEEYL